MELRGKFVVQLMKPIKWFWRPVLHTEGGESGLFLPFGTICWRCKQRG